MLKAATPALSLVAALAAGCSPSPKGPQTTAPGGDPQHGRVLISQIGCGNCHTIPGVVGAHGLVAPPLTNIGERTVIAGVLPNTPENMMRWLEAPQSVVPGNAMPNMEINDRDARDVAAYLYTLR